MKLLMLLACLIMLNPLAISSAQSIKPYVVPLTEHGHPNFQGGWETASFTMMERPPGLPLSVSPEQAKGIADATWGVFPDVLDPDFSLQGNYNLALVRGKYHTSVVITPEDGTIPYTQAGLQLVASTRLRNSEMFDHPEQRPKYERCLEGFGMPPMRMFPIAYPHQIVQNRDHVMIYSEDPGGARIIHLANNARLDIPASFKGQSIGHWDGATLVVKTASFRHDYPDRFGIGRALLIGAETTVHERFTRVSDTELFYEFTVEDDAFYTQPWSGEFSFYTLEGNVYEFSCHEGNYSLPGILRGGQAVQARLKAENPSD